MSHTRLVVAALMFLAAAPSAQSTTDPIGNWKAVFVGPIGPRPKMVSEITFSLQSTPAGLVGTAHAGRWPGDLVVSDVRITGDKVSFTGIGKSASTSGHPKLVFVGTVKGDVMDLAMTWTTTEFDEPNKPPLPMEAKRIR